MPENTRMGILFTGEIKAQDSFPLILRPDKKITLLNFDILQSTNGPMVKWSNGPMDQWSNGSMDQWTNGPMDQWTNGPMDQ